jgi:hypothetical protein
MTRKKLGLAAHKTLEGDPDATMAEARAMLKRAREEVGPKNVRSLDSRQAAEKVWLATSTAAAALVGPGENSAHVFRAFKRAWGAEGEHLARDVEVALHRGCFYSNPDGCDGEFVLRYVTRVDQILKRPIRDRTMRARVLRRG